MAEEAVVKEVLAEDKIAAGKELTAALDETSLRPTSAYWFYYPDANTWRLMYVAAMVADEGPRRAYAIIQKALTKILKDDQELSLQEIGVVEPGNPLVRLLASAIHTGDGIYGVRFSRNTINGQFIEDAYIYRMTD